MNRISFHDTHAYPGCLAILGEKTVRHSTIVPAIAEFSDGSIATAELEQLGPDEMLVRISAYTTARRTRIPAKIWRLRYDNVSDLWKVTARM